MAKVKRVKCLNFEEKEIPVEYLLVHYTGVDLKDTLSIFANKLSNVSAHLVIDENGDVYELVSCLRGVTHKAWHAGNSTWINSGREYSGFNDFSIGIELVNYNGNIFPYTSAQYKALFYIIRQLQQNYPKLRNPDRILGHEHVAGYRGKCDPGHCFEWGLLYKTCFSGEDIPERLAVLPEGLCTALEKLKNIVPNVAEERSKFWGGISSYTETVLKYMCEKKD